MHPNKIKRICKIKLERKKTYRLWTFQSVRAILELKSKGILEASWNRYSETNQFSKPYQWKTRALTDRKISMQNNAPIWAWHSSDSYESAPTLVEARGLLSDIEIADGIQTVEFECPAELVVLSSYRIWNMILYVFFFSGEEAKIDEKMVDRSFKHCS